MAIILQLPYNEANKQIAQGMAEALGGKFMIGDGMPPLPLADLAMRNAILQLQSDARKREFTLHKYDYIWLMKYINEEPKGITLPGIFTAIETFRNYLANQLGINGIGSISLLYNYSKFQFGKFPEWTFTDTKDAGIRLQRVNIVRRFIHIYRQEYYKIATRL